MSAHVFFIALFLFTTAASAAGFPCAPFLYANNSSEDTLVDAYEKMLTWASAENIPLESFEKDPLRIEKADTVQLVQLKRGFDSLAKSFHTDEQLDRLRKIASEIRERADASNKIARTVKTETSHSGLEIAKQSAVYPAILTGPASSVLWISLPGYDAIFGKLFAGKFIYIFAIDPKTTALKPAYLMDSLALGNNTELFPSPARNSLVFFDGSTGKFGEVVAGKKLKLKTLAENLLRPKPIELTDAVKRVMKEIGPDPAFKLGVNATDPLMPLGELYHQLALSADGTTAMTVFRHQVIPSPESLPKDRRDLLEIVFETVNGSARKSLITLDAFYGRALSKDGKKAFFIQQKSDKGDKAKALIVDVSASHGDQLAILDETTLEFHGNLKSPMLTLNVLTELSDGKALLNTGRDLMLVDWQNGKFKTEEIYQSPQGNEISKHIRPGPGERRFAITETGSNNSFQALRIVQPGQEYSIPVVLPKLAHNQHYEFMGWGADDSVFYVKLADDENSKFLEFKIK